MKTYIIKKPVITEKSLALANSQNIYTFEVAPRANKNQIVEAIESLFNVKVERINTIHGYKSVKRTGKKRMPSSVNAKKKALVKLKAGQTIDLFDIGGNK